MFYSFPTETQIDILKFFTYQQLCSIKQTNLYFRDFINKFEGELSRKEFYEISIVRVFNLIFLKNIFLNIFN